MASAAPITALAADRYVIERYLQQLLASETAKANGVVNEVMRYAVLGPGQRIRPILAIRVARMFSAPLDLTLRAAAAVELLHCASLIVDDLPCMDDSPFRRDRPSAHVQFSEAAAVLAAFGLVALAARIVVEGKPPREHRPHLLKFQIALLRSLDCAGLIAGQARDLQLAAKREIAPSFEISELKTVPLFMLAVRAGSLFSDLTSDKSAQLCHFAHQFGLAFQMSDDLQDGAAVSPRAFDEKLLALRRALVPFGAAGGELGELIDYLHARVFLQRAG